MRLLAAFLAAAASSAAHAAPPTPVFAAGGLTVFDDDSYAFALNGTQILASAPAAFHIGGEWFTAAAPAPPPASTCTNISDVDCSGADLYFFPTQSVAACCANCSATPGCGAWTYTGETAPAAAAAPGAAPPYWAHRCYIKSSCAGRHSYVGHVSGIAASAPGRALSRLGAAPTSGAHASLGAYTGWEVRYAANATPVTTAFLYFPDANVLLFNTSFPAGAAGLALLAPGAPGPSAGGEFSASMQPSTQFPVFAAAAGSELGYLTWAGRFFGESAGAFPGSAAQGAEGGPIALFPARAGAPPAAAVLAPFNLAKSNMFGAPLAGAAVAAGLNGYVAAVPAGFSLATSLTASLGGVNAAVHEWGAMLLGARGTVRSVDPSTTQLPYWTGAWEVFFFLHLCTTTSPYVHLSTLPYSPFPPSRPHNDRQWRILQFL
jgi:hypothetical protein